MYYLRFFHTIGDCVWSEWENTTACSTKCGEGTLEQTREQTHPRTADWNCDGEVTRDVSCSSAKECPGKNGME